jgi:hypothetical protein
LNTLAWRKATEEQKESWTASLVKYFLHGIAFSVLYLVLAFVMVFFIAALVMIGFLIGLILGLVILFFALAFINALLTDAIWAIPIKWDPRSLLVHGFILFFALLIVNVPAIIINIIARDTLTAVVLFVVYCFIDGFVAKGIATAWTEEESGEVEKTA